MKASRYNKIIDTKDGKKLAFNSSSCSLAEVNSSFLNMLKDIENKNYDHLDEEEKSLVDNMLLGNYIVHDEIDELKVLKFRNNSGKFNDSSVALTIAPTLNCNFACPYCYETCKNGVISEEVQNSIVEFVEQNAKSKKNVHIGWYGGEPLLVKNVISNLSKKFIEICDENEVVYDSYMVSNGYLIDEDTVKMFEECKIKGIQITIDGPPEIHNERRKLKGKKADTFYPILENVKRLCKADMNVSIRVNIDKTNVQYINDLLDIFENYDMKENATIYFGHVDSYTEACSSVANTCLTTKEYAEFDMKYYKILKEKGFNKKSRMYYPNSKMNYCCADSMNAYVIDPDGYMYKCWNEVGSIEKAVGNILNINKQIESFSSERNKMFMNNVEYLTLSPLEIENCRECWYLPMCMGGCPYNARYNSDNDKLNCEKWKYIIDQVLENTYLEKCLNE